MLSNNPVLPFLKQVIGKVKIKESKYGKLKDKWKNYYDEKEWRFVPLNNKCEVIMYRNEAQLMRILIYFIHSD